MLEGTTQYYTNMSQTNLLSSNRH